MTAQQRVITIVVQQAMMTSTSRITAVTDASSQSTSDDELRDLADTCGPVRSWSSFAVLQQSFAVFLEVFCGPVQSFAVYGIAKVVVIWVSLKADRKTAHWVWKTGHPRMQLLHFSSWRRKYVGLPNSANINWYIYILFWVILTPIHTRL